MTTLPPSPKPARVNAYKGLVLAAGLGSRLRPLTDRWPKPLIPFAGTTPLELALLRLWRAGLQEVALNSHYLPEQIAAAARANLFGQRLHVSHEAEILGTGGVYNPLRAWLKDAHLVVLNGDVVSTIDVEALIAQHEATGAVATMMVLPAVIPGESGVTHAGGHVLAIGNGRPAGSAAHAAVGNFACAQVLSPEFLDLLPKAGTFDVIAKGYLPALARGLTVGAAVHAGFWHDLRTPSFYAAAVFDYLRRRDHAEDPVGVRTCRERRGLATKLLPSGALVSEPELIADEAELGPEVSVDPGVRIGKGAVVRRSILLPGAVVAAGAEVDLRIIGPGLDVPIQAV